MRANRKSHLFEHKDRMSDEVKRQRRNMRLQVLHLNALIKLKAGVYVDIPAEDDESEAIRVTSLSVRFTQKGVLYRVYYQREEELVYREMPWTRFDVALNSTINIKEQIAHLNKIIEHGASIAIEESQDTMLVLSEIHATQDAYKHRVVYRAKDGMQSRLVNWMTFFEVSPR